MTHEEEPGYERPSGTNPDPHDILIDEVKGHHRRFMKLIHLTHSSTRAAGVMLGAAIVSIIIANTGLYEGFLEFWSTHVAVSIGELHGEMSLLHVVNDLLMALFFLLIGLVIKYETTVGELTNIRQAALPIIAAMGGVLMPIVVYSLINAGDPATAGGWGVPTATDIAFALGIMALLGDRVPTGVKVFLSTLAVADDIIAILVIAIFYGAAPSIPWLLAAAAVLVVLIVMNRMHVFALTPYMLVGMVLWFCVYLSGVHATIAGVLLAIAIPSGSRVKLSNFLDWSRERVEEAGEIYDADAPVVTQPEYITTVKSISRISRQVLPPVTRLEHKLHPWVYFAVLPLFALANADVSFAGSDIGAMLGSPVLMGVFFGLVLGKPLGIMLFSFLAVKLRIASLPERVNWMHMLGAAILGGVGFTMAIFVANLAYADPSLIADAKLAILTASLVAGVVGFVVLYRQAASAPEENDPEATAKEPMIF